MLILSSQGVVTQVQAAIYHGASFFYVPHGIPWNPCCLLYPDAGGLQIASEQQRLDRGLSLTLPPLPQPPSRAEADALGEEEGRKNSTKYITLEIPNFMIISGTVWSEMPCSDLHSLFSAAAQVLILQSNCSQINFSDKLSSNFQQWYYMEFRTSEHPQWQSNKHFDSFMNNTYQNNIIFIPEEGFPLCVPLFSETSGRSQAIRSIVTQSRIYLESKSPTCLHVHLVANETRQELGEGPTKCDLDRIVSY